MSKKQASALLRSQVGCLKSKPAEVSKDEVWSEFKKDYHVK